nr:GGDEF domain-containing protein [Aurantimonas sp. VKM B-3413]
MYAFMQGVGWPKSYVGKILAICFVGTHVPLVSIVLWLVLRGEMRDSLPILGVALVATLIGTALTFAGVAGMLAPVVQSTAALDGYSAERRRPALPTNYRDAAGRLMASVQSTVLSLDETVGELQSRATTDPLTGLRNRHWLSDQGVKMVEAAKRRGEAMSLLVIDIDRFKSLNDMHGHLFGDQALIIVADALRESVRRVDQAVRMGGDEFCVLLPGTEAALASEIAERIRQAARLSVDRLLGPDVLTLSIGLSELGASDTGFVDLYSRADGNLYRAKARGRDQLVVG